MSLMHVSVSICHEMLNPVMLFIWYLGIIYRSFVIVLNVLIMTLLKLLSVHVNEKDSIQACDVFIKLESEKYKLHVSDTGST
jgi:hypothetical protein